MYRNILTTTLSTSTSPAIATTTAVAAAPDPATFGQTEVLTATVAPQTPGTRHTDGQRQLHRLGRDHPVPGRPQPVEPGYGQLRLPRTPRRQPTASLPSYAGDSNYASSDQHDAGQRDHRPGHADHADASPTCPPVACSATASRRRSRPTGTGTTSVTSSTRSVCTASGLSVSYVGVGPCTLTAQVASGTDYSGASGDPQSFSVAQGQTTTDLASSANPSVSGQSVSITATVTPGRPRAGLRRAVSPSVWARRGRYPPASGGDTVTLSAGAGDLHHFRSRCTIAHHGERQLRGLDGLQRIGRKFAFTVDRPGQRGHRHHPVRQSGHLGTARDLHGGHHGRVTRFGFAHGDGHLEHHRAQRDTGWVCVDRVREHWDHAGGNVQRGVGHAGGGRCALRRLRDVLG